MCVFIEKKEKVKKGGPRKKIKRGPKTPRSKVLPIGKIPTPVTEQSQNSISSAKHNPFETTNLFTTPDFLEVPNSDQKEEISTVPQKPTAPDSDNEFESADEGEEAAVMYDVLDFSASDNEKELSEVSNFSEESSSEPENTASGGFFNTTLNFMTGIMFSTTPKKPALSPLPPSERKRRSGETEFPADFFDQHENTPDTLRPWLKDRSFFSDGGYRHIIQHYFEQQTYDYFLETFARAYLAVVLWMVDRFKNVEYTKQCIKFKTATETYLKDNKKFKFHEIKNWWAYAYYLPGKIYTQANNPSALCKDCPFNIKDSQSFQYENAELLERMEEPNNPLFADFWDQDKPPNVPTFVRKGKFVIITPPGSEKTLSLLW